MEPKVVVGAIIGVVYFVVLIATCAGIWKRGAGAKFLLSAVTLGVSVALFVAWHKPDDDLLSIVVGLAFVFMIGLTAALLVWVALSSLGLVGDGGFASELARAANAGSDEQARRKLPEMDVKIGDILKFGKLNGKSYGKADGSPIYWRVLDTQDNKALLIAEQYIGREVYQYDAGNVGVTSAEPWVGSNNLRAWLNDDFLKSAFDTDERARIMLSDDNDYVSCLSVDEAKRYFGSDEERRINYIYERRQAWLDELKSERDSLAGDDGMIDKLKAAKRKRDIDRSIEGENESGGWWLRPTGSLILQKHIPYVASDGSIVTKGMHAARSMYVRPIIWIVTKPGK